MPKSRRRSSNCSWAMMSRRARSSLCRVRTKWMRPASTPDSNVDGSGEWFEQPRVHVVEETADKHVVGDQRVAADLANIGLDGRMLIVDDAQRHPGGVDAARLGYLLAKFDFGRTGHRAMRVFDLSLIHI